MDKDKQIELLRKRNIDLSKQLDNLKKNDDADNYKQLISQLEDIKTEWTNSLNKLKEYENEYSELISELRIARKEIKSLLNKKPWYMKIKHK